MSLEEKAAVFRKAILSGIQILSSESTSKARSSRPERSEKELNPCKIQQHLSHLLRDRSSIIERTSGRKCQNDENATCLRKTKH